MALPLAGRADATVGNAIEAAVTMEHRRRLRRLRWERALEPPDDGLWAAGDPAPRQGCSLDVLVDRAQALPAIAEALQSALRFVYVTSWHLAPHLELDPETVAAGEPRALIDEQWRPIAAEQLERRERDLPPTHRLIALPGVSKRSRRILGPLQGLTDDGCGPFRALFAPLSWRPGGRSVRAVGKVPRCFWKRTTPSPRRTDGGERGTHRAFGPRGESPAEGRRSARLIARARQLTPQATRRPEGSKST